MQKEAHVMFQSTEQPKPVRSRSLPISLAEDSKVMMLSCW
ncbi:hypothetical protein C4K26_6159 [Pseudomonas chlororaphis]|nr:hypothetical protein C4K26_6159 [Pseudomonas chlororaphis]